MDTTTRAVRLSRRGSMLPASPIRRLAPHAATALSKGIRILNLNIGQPDIPTPQRMLDRLHGYPGQVVAYGPSQGTPEFLDALTGYYRGIGFEIGPDDLLVTTGGSEAIIMALAVTTDPGDEVIVPEPYYSNYNGFAIALGCTLRPVTTSIADGFRLPPVETFEAAVTDRTRAILICSPNNPTGIVLSRREVEQVVGLAERHGLFVIADEAYREFVFDGIEHVSPMCVDGGPERTIVVDSLSKRYSMCGARLGAFVTRNAEARSAALRYGMARLCPPTIAQHFATAMLELETDYVDRVRDEYQARRDAVLDELAGSEVTCARPQGAFYVTARLPVEDAEDFCIWLLTEFSSGGETVMLAPGSGFYSTPGLGCDEVRIAFVLEREKMRRGMRLMLEGLDRYRRAVQAPVAARRVAR